MPALAAMTPLAFSSGVRAAIRLAAPRTLKDPVRCRFSAFRSSYHPARSLRECAGSMGVLSARWAIVLCARRTSSNVTDGFIVDPLCCCLFQP